MSEEDENEINSEVHVLESIFGDDLKLIERNEKSSVIEMNVKPLESELHSPPTIRVTIEIAQEYPNVSPKVRLWQPRGVDERNLLMLNKEMGNFLQENQGIPILYDIFRKVQEYLELAQNCPSGLCPICLNDFSTKEASIRTHCDHYIHRPCFASYIRFSREEIQRELSEWPNDLKDKVNRKLHCPMCRETLREDDVSELDEEEPQKSGNLYENISNLSADSTDTFDWDWQAWKETQRNWEVVFQRQLKKGGIIDVNEERNRFLITDQTVLEPTIPSPNAFEFMPLATQERESKESTSRDETRERTTNFSGHYRSHRDHYHHPQAIELQRNYPHSSNKNRSRRDDNASAASSTTIKSSSRNQREHSARDIESSHSERNIQQSNRRRYKNDDTYSNTNNNNGYYGTTNNNYNKSKSYASRNYASNSSGNRSSHNFNTNSSNNDNNDNSNNQYYHHRYRKFMPSYRQKLRQQTVHPIKKGDVSDAQTGLDSGPSTTGPKEVTVAPPPGFENLRISSGSTPPENASTSASLS